MVRLASVVHFPVVGSHASAGRIALAALLFSFDFEPPVTRTLPSGSKVAFACRRGFAIGLVYCQAAEAALRSLIAAVSGGTLSLEPPAVTRPLPSPYIPAVPSARAP